MTIVCPDWSSNDKRWVPLGHKLLNLIHNNGPTSPDGVFKLAREELYFGSILMVHVLAWLNINGWAVYDHRHNCWIAGTYNSKILESFPKVGKTQRVRKCSICRVQGHNKSKCPQRTPALV